MNRAQEINSSEGVTLYKFRWRFEMKDGSGVLTSEGPVTDEATGPQQKRTGCGQDSTAIPAIKITKKTKRLIPDGYYEATAVSAVHRRNQYKRWEALIGFDIASPMHAGGPILMRAPMGEGSEPEVASDHWFGRILEHFGSNDVKRLIGWRFCIKVKAVRREHGDPYDRPEGEWYSTARRAVLWDEHVLALKKQQQEK